MDEIKPEAYSSKKWTKNACTQEHSKSMDKYPAITIQDLDEQMLEMSSLWTKSEKQLLNF